jgi:hypothetical protein
MELSYDAAILLLSIYSKEIKSTFQKDTCVPIFIAAYFIFIVARIQNQSKYPSINI